MLKADESTQQSTPAPGLFMGVLYAIQIWLVNFTEGRSRSKTAKSF